MTMLKLYPMERKTSYQGNWARNYLENMLEEENY